MMSDSMKLQKFLQHAISLFYNPENKAVSIPVKYSTSNYVHNEKHLYFWCIP